MRTSCPRYASINPCVFLLAKMNATWVVASINYSRVIDVPSLFERSALQRRNFCLLLETGRLLQVGNSRWWPNYNKFDYSERIIIKALLCSEHREIVILTCIYIYIFFFGVRTRFLYCLKFLEIFSCFHLFEGRRNFSKTKKFLDGQRPKINSNQFRTKE